MSRSESKIAIRSRRVVTKEGTGAATVLVTGGKISAVERASEVPADYHLEDFGDSVIMPGLVDSHVHVNEPGRLTGKALPQLLEQQPPAA